MFLSRWVDLRLDEDEDDSLLKEQTTFLAQALPDKADIQDFVYMCHFLEEVMGPSLNSIFHSSKQVEYPDKDAERTFVTRLPL